MHPGPSGSTFCFIIRDNTAIYFAISISQNHIKAFSFCCSQVTIIVARIMKIFVGILLFALALTSSYGFIRPDRRGRIVGGVAITINQAPYQAAVLIGGYLCGGEVHEMSWKSHKFVVKMLDRIFKSGEVWKQLRIIGDGFLKIILSVRTITRSRLRKIVRRIFWSFSIFWFSRKF